jgi:hypothetical protein
MNFNFTYFGKSYSRLTIYTNGFVEFDTNNSISGLNYDLDTRSSGGIYYQNLSSQSSDFNSIKSDINRLNSAFNPTNLFRITYDNVPAYSSSSLKASFQIILATNGFLTYVLLKYTSCLAGATLRSIPGIYYTLRGGGSSSSLAVNSCLASNVNMAGTWVFDSSRESGN